MPILGDFDNKVKRSGQLEERLSDIELGHKTEKVKTMKMMERTVEFFLELRGRKIQSSVTPTSNTLNSINNQETIRKFVESK